MTSSSSDPAPRDTDSSQGWQPLHLWGALGSCVVAAIVAGDAQPLRERATNGRANGLLAEAEEVVQPWRALRPFDIEAQFFLVDRFIKPSYGKVSRFSRVRG